jgi:recombination protein RecT
MNAVVIRSPVEDYADAVLPPDRLVDIAKSLPAHIKPAVFHRNLLNVLMNNPDLMKHETGYIFREVSKAAGLGLLLDPILGEAYMIDAYDYKTKRKLPQLRVGYRGLMKLARQSGTISQIYAHEVCANDFVKCRLGSDKDLIHEPVLFSDRGPVVGYYAVVRFNDGTFDFEAMSREQTMTIRDRSDAYKAFKSGLIKSTPWTTDEDEMSKKTAIRRLAKRLPQSSEMAEALRIEDAAEFHDPERALALPTRRAPPPPPADIPQIEHATPEKAPDKGAEQKTDAPRRAPPPPTTPQPASDDLPTDFAGIRIAYEAEGRKAKTEEDLNAAWDLYVESHYDRMMPHEQETLLQAHRHRSAELEP